MVSGSKYKSRVKIKFRILQLLAESPASKAKIMYEAGVSSGQMKFYMPDLIKDELIEYVNRSREYKIRNKGRILLENMTSGALT